MLKASTRCRVEACLLTLAKCGAKGILWVRSKKVNWHWAPTMMIETMQLIEGMMTIWRTKSVKEGTAHYGFRSAISSHCMMFWWCARLDQIGTTRSCMSLLPHCVLHMEKDDKENDKSESMPEWPNMSYDHRQIYWLNNGMFEPGHLPDLTAPGSSGEVVLPMIMSDLQIRHAVRGCLLGFGGTRQGPEGPGPSARRNGGRVWEHGGRLQGVHQLLGEFAWVFKGGQQLQGARGNLRWLEEGVPEDRRTQAQGNGRARENCSHRERCRRATKQHTRSEAAVDHSLGCLGWFVKERAAATHALTCGVPDRESNEIKNLKEATELIDEWEKQVSQETTGESPRLWAWWSSAYRASPVKCRELVVL